MHAVQIYRHAQNDCLRLLVQVGSLNFDSNYQNNDEPVTLVGAGDSDGVLRYHVIDDIFTKPNEFYYKVLSLNITVS